METLRELLAQEGKTNLDYESLMKEAARIVPDKCAYGTPYNVVALACKRLAQSQGGK